MKNIKNIVIVLLLLIITSGVTYTANSGSIGGLFEQISSNWFLKGENIKDNSIESSKIQDGTISKDDLAQDFIDDSKIKDNSISSGSLATNSVGNDELVDTINVDDIYNDGWFRNKNSGDGLYNEITTQYFYSDNDNGWNIAGGTDENWLKFRDEHNGTMRGAVFGEENNDFGLLDGDGEWAVKSVKDSHVELRDNNEVTFRAGQGGVSGDYGTVSTHGNGKGSWEGYSINGRSVFMNDGNNVTGIYNDVNNEWFTRGYSNSQYAIYFDGIEKLRTDSNGVVVTGNVYANGFIYSSDKKLKNNIVKLDSSLEKIIKLNGYSYNWKNNGNADIGVIAQEVEKEFPKLVVTKEDGFKAVKYGNLVAPIIEAIKELYNKHLDQDKKIKSLEERIEKLELLIK